MDSKFSVIDANYPSFDHWGMAASWIKWEMQKRGIAEYHPADADYLLCTVSSQQGVSALRGKLKRINNKRAKIILGGGGCYAPAAFDGIADVICVGEGGDFIDCLLARGIDAARELPETWIPGDTKTVVPSRSFPWDIPPVMHPDGFLRVFASRNCKSKCLFCQTGWENAYQRNPYQEELERKISILSATGKKYAVVTNDAAEEPLCLLAKSEFLSGKLAGLKILNINRNVTNGVRIGVEGVSERLRIAVGKPVHNDDLLSCSLDWLSKGVGVRWFFVVGLPGENESDYEELRRLVYELRKIPKGVAMLNFHAYIPQPATPLCVLPLVDEYWERFDEFRRWFFHGPGFTRHCQIIAPSKYPNRLKCAMESMAATETELRRGWFDCNNPNWRVQYIKPPEELRRIARIYQRKVYQNGNRNGYYCQR